MTAGAAEGTEACTVEEYECWADFANAPTVDYLLDESVSYTNNEPEAPDVPQVLGRMVSAVVYKAVRSGCVKDCFYGVEVDSYTCQGVTVAAEDFVAARGFCRQRCLGGAVQVTAHYLAPTYSVHLVRSRTSQHTPYTSPPRPANKKPPRTSP